MINKTPLGIAFFDAEYGGVFRDRSLLVTGRSGAGKTKLGLQFMAQGLRSQERGLMLSTERAVDLAIMADALDIPVSGAIETGAFTVLEYNEFVPGRDHEASIMLPPDGFVQLKQIIETNAIQRVVIDTVLPWITLPDPTHLAEHLFSLVRAFERLGVTTLFTLAQPVSAAASRLRKMLEDVVPISITLQYEPATGARHWLVNKYLGLNPKADSVRYDILPKKGIVPHPPAAVGVGERPVAPAPGPAPGRDKVRPTSFASLVLNQSVGASRSAAQGGAGSGRSGP